MDWTLIVIGAATFLLAGLVKGVIGLGLPTVAMGIMGSVLHPAAAAALLVMPTFVTNIWQMASGTALRPLFRRLWPLLLAMLPGIWLTSGLLTGPNTRFVLAALGIALMANGTLGLSPRRFPPLPRRHEAWAGPLAGFATGMVTGATGVAVIPLAPYLGALGLTRDDMVQALGMGFTMAMLGLTLSLGTAGVFDLSTAWASAACLVPALIGMTIGNALRRRITPEAFRRWFNIGLLVLGAQLVLRALV